MTIFWNDCRPVKCWWRMGRPAPIYRARAGAGRLGEGVGAGATGRDPAPAPRFHRRRGRHHPDLHFWRHERPPGAMPGLGRRAAEINRRAVELARQAAAGTDVLVAASIGPTGQLLKPFGPLDEAEAERAFAEQARALAEAGADLLVIETQFDLAEARIALRAARAAASGLPLVCSFSYDRGTRTMMGVQPAQMAGELEGLADVLGINCGRSLDDNLKALQELRAATALPVWFKPNAGLPQLDEDGQFVLRRHPREDGRPGPRVGAGRGPGRRRLLRHQPGAPARDCPQSSRYNSRTVYRKQLTVKTMFHELR